MPPRVLVTREAAAPLDALLRERALVPVHVPLLALGATGEAPPPGRPDVALVTSAAAARFAPRLAETLGDAAVVAVGEATARALREVGVTPSEVGEGGGADAVERVRRLGAARGPIAWHIGAMDLSADLDSALRAWGPPIARWRVYENRLPEGAGAALAAVLPLEVVTFASGSAAAAFASLASQGNALVAAIGEPTARAAREAGLRVHRVAARPTMEALADVAAALAYGA